MNVPSETHDIAVKATVGATGSIYSWLNMPLSTWVALATLIYMLCQIVVIVPKVIDTIRKALDKRRTSTNVESK